MAKLLHGIDDDFDEKLRSYPVHFVKSPSSVGYNGSGLLRRLTLFGIHIYSRSSLIRNLRVLYPIFPTVAILLHKVLPDLSEHTKEEIFKTIRDLISEESHILLVPANLSFRDAHCCLRPAEQTELMLNKLYQRANTNMMVKREVLLAMTCRRADHLLSQQLERFSEVTPWERRALLLASYVLADEGRHWRDRV